jgi:hypothetical protein
MSFGKFKGDVVARWLTHDGDDRDMELQKDFSYTDPDGVVWMAPKGSVVNGASIPGALWATVGSPFVGDYRRASVIHDVACGQRRQPHEAVHLMFYSAMRADGVSWSRANVMYQAVKQFGPKWGTTGATIRKGKAIASDEEVQAFARAVEAAAEQTDESEGLDAVENKAFAILSGSFTETIAPSARTGKRGVGKNGTSVSNPASKVAKASMVTKIKKLPSPNSIIGQIEENPLTMSQLNPAVRAQLAGTRLLSGFRKRELECLGPIVRSFVGKQNLAMAGDTVAPTTLAAQGEDGLSDADRLRLVDQALILLEQNYAHRPLKEAMHAINPVQKLKLLREEVLANQGGASFTGDVDFHRKLLAIFLSTRDLHTNYLLPDPFGKITAYLPFLVEDYFDQNNEPSRRRFLVTRGLGDMPGTFGPGVEILRWNGIPIERAVELNGERFAGSNREASRARGLETLTVRPLMQSLPPDEDFVLVEYRTADGTVSEARFDWLVFSPDSADAAAFQNLDKLTATAQGIDLEQAMVRLAKRVLFAPKSVAEAAAAKTQRGSRTSKGKGLQSIFPEVLQARAVNVDGRDYAYVRVRTFSVNNADAFVNEFVRLVGQLPQDGLIIDVRGNGGGLILAGEQLLQVLTPKTIEPSLFQLLNTPLNRRLVERLGFLSEWRDSMRQAIQIGAPYSQGFPITSPQKTNEIGQKYHGPVTLITDALCYSTTDIFAAGFQDHEIGTIIGIDNNTGAGGANVWTQELLLDFMQGDDASPYLALPSNAGMRVSIRRTIRVGKSNGTVLEDLGVVPDILHAMTREDLLNDNVDLLSRAAAVFADRPVRGLKVEIADADNDSTTLSLVTRGLDRVDIYQDSRPLGSVDVEDGTTEVEVSQPSLTGVRLLGFDDNELVASRKL